MSISRLKVHPSCTVIKRDSTRYGARNCSILNAAGAGFGFPANSIAAIRVCLVVTVLSVRWVRQSGVCFREFVATIVGWLANSSSYRRCRETLRLNFA
jgi:hypothetical protein